MNEHKLFELVEKKYGGKIDTPRDFTALSKQIEVATGHKISDSTLKRLWGYVKNEHNPTKFTLNILSIYTGYKNYDEFNRRMERDIITINEKDIHIGDVISVLFDEGEYLKLEYRGDKKFLFID